MDWFASTIASLACSLGSAPMTPEHPPRRNTESEITTMSARRFIMCAMNEESLPPFAAVALRSFPGALKRALNRLFKRPERLKEKAERLERAETPSESARNRAERARSEVEAGLAALRASFAASAGGREGWRAFDREVERRYPSLRFSDGSP